MAIPTITPQAIVIELNREWSHYAVSGCGAPVAVAGSSLVADPWPTASTLARASRSIG